MQFGIVLENFLLLLDSTANIQLIAVNKLKLPK